jgi:NAD dependent epimerase/dehydratase
MTLKNKSILVTGAGGFIGSHLTERLLKEGSEVTAFIHYNSKGDWGFLNAYKEEKDQELKVILGDITDYESIKQAVRGKDIVFNLAALIGIPYSYMAPRSYIQTNTLGTFNVLQASLDENVEKVVQTSTSEVYGTAQYIPIDEKHPLQGQSPYSASKIGSDKMAEAFFCSFGLNVATIRPFNTYGPRQSTRAVIPTIISQALSSDTVHLGSITPVRDFNYVSDTVNGFITIAENPNSIGKVINIGSGREVTIGEVAQIIISKANPGASIITEEARTRPDKSEVMKLICDNSLAERELNWKPRVSLEEGIHHTIEWFKENIKQGQTPGYAI